MKKLNLRSFSTLPDESPTLDFGLPEEDLLLQVQERLPLHFDATLPSAIPHMSKLPNLETKNNKVLFSTGNFSSISLAKYEKSVVLLKKVQLAHPDEIVTPDQAANQTEPVYAFTELALLQNLEHDHILPLRMCCLDYDIKYPEAISLLVGTEFLDRGDVKSALKPDLAFFKKKINAQDLDFVWKQRCRVILHIAKALEELHNEENRIVHRDIKTENMFLQGRGRRMTCKLGDFGFARHLPKNDEGSYDGELDERTYTICGTDELMAPEMLLCLEYGLGVDVYSFGLVIVELICGRSPTPRHDHEDLVMPDAKVAADPILRQNPALLEPFLLRSAETSFDIDKQLLEEIRTTLLPGAPYKLLELVEKCLAYEPAERISAAEVVEFMENLIDELQNRRAKRVPSVVPPKDWVFDPKVGNFIPIDSKVVRKRVNSDTKRARREIRHLVRSISKANFSQRE